MDNLTYLQKVNLGHLLIIFPAILITIHPEWVPNFPVSHKTMVQILTILIVLGIFYHLYRFKTGFQ